jgi:hypothetical protein
MGDLADRMGVGRAEVFRRAMTLYLRAKQAELDHQAHVVLEEGSKRTELVGV